VPNQDGSLTGSDIVTLTRALDRIIPVDDSVSDAGALGLHEELQSRASTDSAAQSAFLRVVEALSLDMLSHAVGGFAALTEDEQISSLQKVENTLPKEFSVVLALVRDIYYEHESTPNRPPNFDIDSDIFGKGVVE
jgi:hypothetical protein